MEREIVVDDLAVGMYVCRLDRDWRDTPFPLQGVLVRSQDDIEALREYSRRVVIDIERGIAPSAEGSTPSRAARGWDAKRIEQAWGSVVHRDSASFEEELPRAREASQTAARFVARVLDEVRAGNPISSDDVRQAVSPLVGSVLRNSDAFFWIDSLRKRDAYQYSHALNCAALATAFGRHIGFPADLLSDLATGGLLLDVGKLRIPQALLGHPGALNAKQTVEMRQHVEHGLEIVAANDAMHPHVLDMIRSHHERSDGSGYPARLIGDAVPLLARIAAVVDSYDAMTSDRGYRNAMSRHDALQELYRRREQYGPEIVEQFLQCLSVYPVGSLLELDNGQVAVVMAQNAARRLQPRVMLLTDADKLLLPDFVMVDLMRQGAAGEAPALSVLRTLPLGAYGLDPGELFL